MREMRLAVPAMMVWSMAPAMIIVMVIVMVVVMMPYHRAMVMPAVMMMIACLGIGSR